MKSLIIIVSLLCIIRLSIGIDKHTISIDLPCGIYPTSFYRCLSQRFNSFNRSLAIVSYDPNCPIEETIIGLRAAGFPFVDVLIDSNLIGRSINSQDIWFISQELNNAGTYINGIWIAVNDNSQMWPQTEQSIQFNIHLMNSLIVNIKTFFSSFGSIHLGMQTTTNAWNQTFGQSGNEFDEYLLWTNINQNGTNSVGNWGPANLRQIQGNNTACINLVNINFVSSAF